MMWLTTIGVISVSFFCGWACCSAKNERVRALRENELRRLRDELDEAKGLLLVSSPQRKARTMWG